MQDQERKLKFIRAFLAVSISAYEFARKINEAFGNPMMPTDMEILHVQAKIEANKENPDMEILDKMFLEMENLAAKNAKSKQFEVGGLVKSGRAK